MPEGKVSIEIPADLYEAVKRRVELSQGEFKSVEEYVEFVLREVVKEEEEPTQAYTPEEEEKVKERLRSLGYL
ncbi:TPA: CopG family transcriptional regulator [Candidatus Bathyarchaeota archaeon]|nr:CopG family transcriptional regulator [Candidatus Bathyarchaeota archaeon]